MSDFIYSKNVIEKGELTKEIKRVYHEDSPPIKEYHGEWGSLAVSCNLYKGFQPYQNDEHICIVLGGPLLCFNDTLVLDNMVEEEGTKAIYNRILEGEIKWDEDLSGPFTILLINKNTKETVCITDLMSFIPVYYYRDSESIILSTHVDILARISGQENNIDIVSEVDFILNGIVTYPYTCYINLRQISPASINSIRYDAFQLLSENYWTPKETYVYQSISQAALELRHGLQNYVNSTVGRSSNVAQFISGGEDSRTISGLLPYNCNRNAFVFLDNMNREGKVAKKAAITYGASFNISTRTKKHYLDILPDCSDLVGKGSQYIHAHTFGFHKSCRLNKYPAVFGGLFSDALLKGSRIKKLRGSSLLPFFPQMKRRNYSAAKPLKNDIFEQGVLEELNKRRQEHLNFIKNFRKESAEEWFYLWPSSMNENIPNLHVNRRLFRSFEPFMSKEVVKISASVPQKWKLNRKLFHKASKPFLKPTKWLFHGDGRLPYFPWYINMFIQFLIWCFRKIGVKIGIIKGNQGPWGEWDIIMNSQEWKQAIHNYASGVNVLTSVLKEKDVSKLFESNKLNKYQRINLLQTLYSNQRIIKKGNSSVKGKY